MTTDRADKVGALGVSSGLDPNGAPPGYYYQLGDTTHVEDAAGTYSAAGASAPTLADAGTYIPVTGATSVVVELQDPAGRYSTAGASAPTIADAAAYIPGIGATSVAAQIQDPAGTYSPAGASAPIADPGGTYSAAGASAPTVDPAGTYSSPYALDRLFVEINSIAPVGRVLSFGSVTAVENYFGASSSEASLANEFFAGYAGAPAEMLFTNYPYIGEPAQLLGGDVSSLTLSQLQSINGSLSLTVNGFAYSATVNLSGVQSFSDAAAAIRNAFNTNLPTEATTSGDTITPVSVSFTGTTNGRYLEVTSVSGGSIELGSMISGAGVPAGAQIVSQINGTPGGVGLYVLLASGGVVASEAMTESYGVLTVGNLLTGIIKAGEQVAGAGIAPLTAIERATSRHLGSGSTWIVDIAQTVAGATAHMLAAPLAVQYQTVAGATANRGYFDISDNGSFGFDNFPSTISYAGGTAAAGLGLTQASGAALSNPGGQTTNAAQFMANLVQNETNQFGSFQVTQLPTLIAQYDPTYQGDLANWAQSTNGLYPDLTEYTTTTPPAGSSAPNTDPAGTYSGPGASAPTPADPGTYIPVTGATSVAEEITDPAGAYSAGGASVPTTDPAGTYSAAGASAPTLADPGTYIPVTGATSVAAELQDPAGTYSAAGASAPTKDPAGTYSGPGASAPIVDPAGTYSAAGASAPTTDPAGTYTSPYALTRLFLDWKNSTPDNTILSFNSAAAVANYYGAKSSEAILAKDYFAGYGSTPATMLFTRLGIERRPHLLGANLSNITLKQLDSISGSLAITLQGYTYSGLVNLAGITSFAAAASAIQTALDSNLQVVAVTAGSSITPVSVSFTGSINAAHLTVTSVSSGTIEIGAKISGPGIAPGSEIISQTSGTPGGVGTYTLFSSTGIVQSESITENYGVLTVGGVSSGTIAVGQELTGAGVLSNTAILGNLSGAGPGSTWLVDNAQTITDETLTTTAPPLTVTLDWDGRQIVGATENNDFFNVSVDGHYGFNTTPATLSYMSGTAAAALGLTQASGAINSSPGGQDESVADFMSNVVLNEVSQFSSFQTDAPNAAQELAAWALSNPDYQYLTSQLATSPAGSAKPITDPVGTYSGPGASAPTLAAAGTYIPVTGATSAAAEIVDPAGTYSLSGASAPTTDPAGTYSGPGASAPTLADAGTYIPVTGATSVAAEIEDSPGTYSLAGASKPTFAQPGYYVPTAGASCETPVDPGYYQPNHGGTQEFLAHAPTITGVVAKQSIPSGQTDTPFSSVTIGDPNIDTTDSLSIELTGGGGALSDGAGFNGLTRSASGAYALAGTAAAITAELDALIFTPNTYSATTTFTLTDTNSVGLSITNAMTTVIVTGGAPPVVSVTMYLADPSMYDQIEGGFDILATAAKITTNLDRLDDPNIDAITVSDDGGVGPDVQQLTTDATAIGKLENADDSPVLLAVNDTVANVQAGLSTLVADAGEIGSITASDGSIVVSAAAFLTDQPALDKVAGGFDVSDTAANLAADLDQLDDPSLSAITISDSGQIGALVAQLTNDATAIGKLQNANSSSVLLAIIDTTADVQAGLSTLVADTNEIGSIAASDGQITVSPATYLADQSTLDKLVGGIDIADGAANVVADLPTLNADPHVAALTLTIGDATLSGGVGVNAPIFSEGFGTTLAVNEALAYGGVFNQDTGAGTTIATGDSLSLTGTANLSGTTSGAGTLALAGGSATIGSGALITASTWVISGAGTDVTLDEGLTYEGSFSEGAGDTFVLSGGNLLLSGATTFAGGTVDGSNVLITGGTTTVSGLTIGGTAEWKNTNTVNESGGSATIGDANGNQAFLLNTTMGTYDILDDSGIGLGASAASYITNAGLIEKTGGTATSAIAPVVTNNGTLEVSAGTLDFQGKVSGSGSDIISGAASLEFDANVSAGQVASFTGSGGELVLTTPGRFAGLISGFDTIGSNDTIEVASPWVFTGFTENAAGTEGTLGFSTKSGSLSLTLLGEHNAAEFVHQSGPNGSTLITYA